MAAESPPFRKILLTATLVVVATAIGRLGYEAWKNPAGFQQWRGTETLQAQVMRVEVRRVEGHAQLTVTGNFRQEGSSPLRLEPPLVSLLVAGPDGGGVHPGERFTGAFLAEPVLPDATAATVALHYWLPVAELGGLLSLIVDGVPIQLKNEPGFSVDSLPNGQTVGLSFPDGKILPGPTSS
ncbi:MAG: hypothetical protein V4726_24580 [Verrucomicrobiota bacterium]